MLLHCWWECKLIQPLWKTAWRFLTKLGIKPPYDPEIPLLSIYPEEIKIEKEFIAALFMIARTWKQPRCPSTDEWIKLWYIYTMEYYLGTKRNAYESVPMRWMNLEPIIHSDMSQKEKDKYHILTYVWFPCVCPLMPSCNTYHLTWVSLIWGVGYLFTASPAKRSCCSLPWTRGISPLLPPLTLNVE